MTFAYLFTFKGASIQVSLHLEREIVLVSRGAYIRVGLYSGGLCSGFYGIFLTERQIR